jgi:hypothetical protein
MGLPPKDPDDDEDENEEDEDEDENDNGEEEEPSVICSFLVGSVVVFKLRNQDGDLMGEREEAYRDAAIEADAWAGDGGSRSCFFEPVACSSASLRISASKVLLPSSLGVLGRNVSRVILSPA